MKKIFRKAITVLASTALIGATMGAAVAANYPSPFVGGAVVYGANAAPSDFSAATDVVSNLDANAVGTGGLVTGTTGDVVSLDTSSTRIWLNTSLNTAKTVFTKTSLPVVLADETFSGNVDSAITQTIKFAAGDAAGTDNSGKVIFSKQPSSNTDPKFGISLGTSHSDDILYNASVTFGTAVMFNNTDSEGESIRLFGKDFVVSTATTATKLVLFSSATEVNFVAGGANPSTTSSVVIDGTTYTVELITGTSTTATIAVNGESKEVTEGASKKINGIDVAVKSVTESTALDTVTASVLVGSNKITFQAGSQVLMGSDDNPVDGTFVYLTGTPDALTGLTIATFRPDSSNDAILPGQSFVDPVFGSFKVDFAGMNIADDSADREIISVQNSGDDTISVKFTDANANAGTVEFAHNASGLFYLADDSNYTMFVREMSNLSELDYVILGNEDSGRILQLTDIYNQTTGTTSITNDRVKFKDVMDSTKTYSTSFTTTEGTGTVTIEGKEYAVTFEGTDEGGWVQVKYPAGDSANAQTFIVYPTVKTKNSGLLAFYEPLTMYLGNVDRLGQDTTTTLRFPDGDGYTDAVLTHDGLYNWTLSGTGITGATINATLGVAYANISIGQLKYNLSVPDVNSNFSTLYLLDPEAGVNIDQPAIVLFEGKDDKNEYHAVVVDLEDNSAATSSNGVGVNDVLFTSKYYHASATLNSDSDLTRDADFWGTITTLNADDSDQKTASISYPASQIYAQVYVGEADAVVGTGSEAGAMIVKDVDVANAAGKNLVVVGGSAINSVAAELLGGAYSEGAFTTAVGVGAGQFLIGSYNRAGKTALLVAGYNAADTTKAAAYLLNNDVDTTVGTMIKKVSSSYADIA